MQQKFECLHCKHVFMADDHEGTVVCPHCKSDNVQPARFQFPFKALITGLCVVGCTVVVYLLAGRCNSAEQTIPGSNPNSIIPDTTGIPQEEIVILEEDSDQIARIQKKPELLTVLKPEFADGSYTFKVEVKNAPETDYDIVLLDHKDNKKVISRSKDGHFANVPISELDGLYDMAVADASSGELLCEPIATAGFVKQEQAPRKLSKEELQQWLNMYDDDNPLMDHQDEFVAPDCKITGVNDGMTLFDVNMRVVEGRWDSVTVVSVSYDNLNRISSVSLLVEQ